MAVPQNILIIGQGLAGSILSFNLYKRGIQHTVLDNGHQNSSTKAAAGLINPITGKRFVKSWMIDELLPKAISTYSELEKLLITPLVTETEVIRSMMNAGQENHWISSTSRPGYDKYFSDDEGIGPYENFVHKRFSYRKIKHAVRVDIATLIVKYAEFLESKKMLIIKEFEYHDRLFETSPVRIDDKAYDVVIFCEGYRATENPYFNYLPFEISKGESFEIHIPGLKAQNILRDGIFLIPMANGHYWSGGDYEWEPAEDTPSAEFKDAWTKKLNDLLTGEYTIVDHKAGIRPGVDGRRPLIGTHSKYGHLKIFNGLGTKGTSLAPYWAEKFCHYLLEEQELDPAVNINRFAE